MKTEFLKSDLEKDIIGAEQAQSYFSAMLKAHAAMGELIKSQMDYATEKLNELKSKSQKNEK